MLPRKNVDPYVVDDAVARMIEDMLALLWRWRSIGRSREEIQAIDDAHMALNWLLHGEYEETTVVIKRPPYERKEVE